MIFSSTQTFKWFSCFILSNFASFLCMKSWLKTWNFQGFKFWYLLGVRRKTDRYLLGFVMKISDGHPYQLYIKRTPGVYRLFVVGNFWWIMDYGLGLWRLFIWKQNDYGTLFLVEEFSSLCPVILIWNCYQRNLYLYYPGGEQDKPTDRDQQSWVFLNYPLTESPKNTFWWTENPKNAFRIWPYKSKGKICIKLIHIMLTDSL